ncbi:threonylcarbamoyl-AMP synthase [Calidifontibacter sp. DB0510]|uniref:L-threonylcarbamoyladenylate synthase n=1 Tax=Metallococcus carri TaxID=1656884 RepID=A0A967B330_9MICO|nr:L-threonylcarbamoyladenylate synthase [Metallococcus carri]NHN56380.1 threonylcarbamoyl-AMP synthase [Metallococcus carri]NOP36004.1 threonylcarbamoyl-AMP synthase [Calidifontibacter sp. DB2511S]
MSPALDCTTQKARDENVPAAVEAIRAGELIVLPTDTVYGIGADAFNAHAVEQLLAAKGRGRDMPPPVLIPDQRAVDGLAMNVPSYAKRLMERFWPGGLTLVLRAQPSLAWDLGDTNGTVGLRIPDDEVALAVLRETGPLAVSSANRTGEAAATTVTEAGFALGPAVRVYLDGGPRTDVEPSTIIDCTKADPVVLRLGSVSPEAITEVLAGVELVNPFDQPVIDLAKEDEPPIDLTKGGEPVPDPATESPDGEAAQETTEPH